MRQSRPPRPLPHSIVKGGENIDPIIKLGAAIKQAEESMPTVHAAALGLVGEHVVITSYDLGGEPYERTGTLMAVEPWAQYPWSLLVRPKGKRRRIIRFRPDGVTAIRPV